MLTSPQSSFAPNNELSVRRMSLLSRLRAATRGEHEMLERSLELLAPLPTKDRFIDILEGFWGFHVVWESVLRQFPEFDELLTGRSKLDHLRNDLIALGISETAIARLPVCDGARDLAGTRDRAIGSLYVLEGSTLGGRVISAALNGLPWVPDGGLRYFQPYGENVGPMWRNFQAALEDMSAKDADPVIEAGAVQTFQLLRHWLAPKVPA